MRFALNLYTTPKTKKHLPTIMNRLRKRRLQPDIWLITLASNQKNLLDIFRSVYYLQPAVEKMNPEIVGIAENEEEARNLVIEILKDVHNQNENFDVRSYFKFQE